MREQNEEVRYLLGDILADARSKIDFKLDQAKHERASIALPNHVSELTF